MRKPIKLLLLFAILHQQANSQLSNYSFAASSGTYTAISGTTATVSALTDGVTGLLPIGFTFWYNGINYTQFGASTNGKIRLGAVLTALTEGDSYTLQNHPERPILVPLFDHLKLSSASGLTYQTGGTAPNRILTVQWAQVFWPSSEISPAIEFQLKLYETSNRIEFIYKPLTGGTLGAFGFIGISAVATGSGNYLSLSDAGANPTVSSSSMTIIQSKPSLGRTYAFIAPAACAGTPVGGTTVSSNTSICSGFNFSLSVTGDTQADLGLTYQWQSSPDGSTWSNIASATGKTLLINQIVATQYRRAITCSGNTTYSTPVIVGLGSAPPVYATLPYTQNFENDWISNCATRELPSMNWRNTPLTGDRSWRRDDDYIAGGWTNNSGAPITIGNTTHSARFHIRDEFSGPPPTSGTLDLYVDCSATGNKVLRFKHYQAQVNTTLDIFYSINGGTDFLPLASVQGVGQWREQNFILPSNSPTTIIRFKGTGQPFAAASDHAIDDVQVSIVNCLFPTNLNISNIQTTTADATWDAVAGALGFEYAVATGSGAAQPPASGTFIANSSVSLSGLTISTSYWLHVRTKCGSSSFSSWTSIYFTTSVLCSNATAITCGTPITVNIPDGYGVYDLWESDPTGHCGNATFGAEKLLLFKPQISASYSMNVSGNSGGYTIHYYIKDAAQGCAAQGWTCLGTTLGPKTFSLGTLVAGKEYYILEDNFTIINGHNETFEIVCPPANADCANGNITPASASICGSASQVLTTSGGTAYQWFRNGVLIGGAIQNTYTATLTGNYAVSITNGTCTKLATNAAVITVTASPAIPVVSPAGNTNLCDGVGLQFTVPSVAGITYQWLRDNTPISGANSNTYIATLGGSYTMRETNANSCSEVSLASTLTIFPNPPVPTITAGGPTTFCDGSSVLLTSSATGGSHQWIRSGLFIGGANGATYTATSAGVYTDRFTAANGCDANSAGITVTVTPSPPKPGITATGNLLTSSSAANNQWLLNGSPIAGATSQSYAAVTGGAYTVQVTAGGCTSTSDAYNFVATAIVDPTAWNNEVTSFPNPTSDKLYILNNGNRKLAIRLVDTNGKTVMENNAPVNSVPLSLKKLPAGIYLLMITDIKKRETLVKTILKN